MCLHKYNFLYIFFNNARGDAPPPDRPKIWHARHRGYLIFYLSYNHVTCYTYRFCCPFCKDLPL